MPFVTRRRTRLQFLGVVVLLVGLSVGGFIYWHGLRDGSGDDDVLAAQDQSKAYDLAMQRNVGPVGLLMDRWSDKLAQLGRPKPLGIVIMVVSGLTAGGFFLTASRRSD